MCSSDLRRQAEEHAASAAAARAALEAQSTVAAAAVHAPSSGFAARAKALLLRHGDLLAGAVAVLLIGIAIGDWAGRNAVIEAKFASRAMQEMAEVQLRVDADIDAFNQRLAARKPNAQAAPRKKATAERK